MQQELQKNDDSPLFEKQTAVHTIDTAPVYVLDQQTDAHPLLTPLHDGMQNNADFLHMLKMPP
jgi:hypothetical protein